MIHQERKLAFILVGATYIMARLVTWVLSLPTITGADSHSYLPGPGLSAPGGWYVGFEKFSLTGDGVIRPWTITLPYAILGTDYLRSAAQMLFSALAFLLLAEAVRRFMGGRILGSLGAVTVLVFSLSTVVTSWDMNLQRESLSITYVALLVALVLFSRVGSVPFGFLLLAVLALVVLVTRPNLVFLVFCLAVVGVWDNVKHLSIRRQMSKTSKAALFAASFVVFSVVAGYSLWVSGNSDRSWASWYGQTMSETQFGYVVSDYNPRAEQLKSALLKSDAACIGDSLPVYTGDWEGAPWGFTAAMKDQCPDFAAWFETNWPRWYYRFLTTDPTYSGKLVMSGLPEVLAPWEGTSGISAIPGPVAGLMFPSKQGSENLGTYDPMFGYLVVPIAALITLLVAMRGRILLEFRRYRKAVEFVVAVGLGAVISAAATLVLIPSFPLENFRVNIVPSLALRLLSVLMALGVISTAVSRFRAAKISRFE